MIGQKTIWIVRRLKTHIEFFGIRATLSKCWLLVMTILPSKLKSLGWLNNTHSDVHKRAFKINSLEYGYLLDSAKRVSVCRSDKTITWIVPEFGTSSGGHRTIFRHIANLRVMGIDSRLVVLEVGQRFSVDHATKNLPSDLNIGSLEVVMAKDIEQIGETFVVTSWHTAFWARAMLDHTMTKGYYFIQDNESLFYASGSSNLLALETYRMQYTHIYASRWLADTISPDKKSLGYVVDLGVDIEEFRTTEAVTSQRIKRIRENKTLEVGIYYRPVTERRMKEHAYLLLEYISKNDLDIRLHFFGWDWARHDWPHQSKWHLNHGIVRHRDLASLMRGLDACVLLGSTNVSLMPLETIAAGLPTFVNEGDNNSCLLGDLPIYLPIIPEELCKRIEEFATDRELLVSRIAYGLEKTQDMDWMKRTAQLRDILLAER